MRYSTRNLCKYFHRISECPESDARCSCICKDPQCQRKSVCCVARYRRGDTELIRTYVNLSIRKGVVKHAEQLFVEDRSFEEVIREAPGGTLTLYLTFQPCHFSGGNTNHVTNISCTVSLKEYFSLILEPLGVALFIKVANLYRAHWRRATEMKTHWRNIRNAEAGIHILRTFADVDSFSSTDWSYIESLFSPTEVPDEHRLLRSNMDAFCKLYLDLYKTIETSHAPIPYCSECS